MATYIVRSGDTLSKLYKQLGYKTWQDLYNANKAVIGSNYNLIRPGQRLTYGGSTPSATPAPAPAPAPVAPTESVGTQAGNAAYLTPFAEVLPWEQYFPTELAQGSAEQAYANYYAPIAQQRQGDLESSMASRGLTRSGIRNQSVEDLYMELGRQQQKSIEADVLAQQNLAKQDYGMYQNLYESSEGKQKPATTQYTPYQVAKPKTSAGTYGSSYLDWLNRATRV